MKKIIFPVFAIVVMSSCNRYYYMPSTQNVPLFKEKNEFRASVSKGQGDETKTTDAQAAYSITNNIAVITNLMWATSDTKGAPNGGQGKYCDAALGYFKPLGANGVFEIFGGLGKSNQNHWYDEDKTANLSYTRAFIQPSIGFTSNAYDVALTPTISRVHFSDIKWSLDADSPEYLALERIAQNRNSILFEPAITMRGGWKYLKLQVQLGWSQNWSHPNLQFEKTKMSAGLSLAFGKRLLVKNTALKGEY